MSYSPSSYVSMSAAGAGPAAGLEGPCSSEFVKLVDTLVELGGTKAEFLALVDKHYAYHHAMLRRSGSSVATSSVRSWPNSRMPRSPSAASAASSGRWKALRKVSSWRSGTSASSLESAVQEEGYCYLSMVRQARRDDVVVRLGRYPSLGALSELTEQDVDFAVARELELVGSDVLVHMQPVVGALQGDSLISVLSTVVSGEGVAGSVGAYCKAECPVPEVSRAWRTGIGVGSSLEAFARVDIQQVLDTSELDMPDGCLVLCEKQASKAMLYDKYQSRGVSFTVKTVSEAQGLSARFVWLEQVAGDSAGYWAASAPYIQAYSCACVSLILCTPNLRFQRCVRGLKLMRMVEAMFQRGDTFDVAGVKVDLKPRGTVVGSGQLTFSSMYGGEDISAYDEFGDYHSLSSDLVISTTFDFVERNCVII